MTEPISALDRPWVPVRCNGELITVTVRDALVHAHRIDGIDGDLVPIEREALSRWLEALTATVLHGCDPDDLADDGVIPADVVDAFFAEHANRFVLNHPDTPFMQEWHVDPDDLDVAVASGKPAPRSVVSLSVRTEGGSSSSWGVADDERGGLTGDLLPLLLITFWASTPAWNAAAPGFYRPTRYKGDTPTGGTHLGGAVMTGAGQFSTFHMIGDTLAQTLSLNIPRTWLTSGPPAWLDQDRVPSKSELADESGLWRSTWASNRPILTWDDQDPTGVYSGVTVRDIPMVVAPNPAEAEIESVKRTVKEIARQADLHRVWDGAEPKAGEPRRFVNVPKGIGTTRGFVEWFAKDRDLAVEAWTAQPRVAAPGRGTTVAVHILGFDGKGMTQEYSRWVELPVTDLVVPVTARADLGEVVRFVTDCASKINHHLTFAVDGSHPARPGDTHALTGAAKNRMYAGLDDVLVAVRTATQTGALDPDTVKDQIARIVTRSFDIATEPAVTASTIATVEKGRAGYRRAVHLAKNPLNKSPRTKDAA